MSNPEDARRLALALEERLGAPVGEAFDGLLAVEFADGGRSEALFQPDGRHVLLTTRVESAHDGLLQPLLFALLARNAPGGGLAGGTLRVRPNQDRLEIADLLPLGLGADAIANVMINQANAAAALSRWIDEQVAAA